MPLYFRVQLDGNKHASRANGPCCFNVNNNSIVRVDGVDVGVREYCGPVAGCGPFAGRVRMRSELGFTGVAAPNALSSSTSRYSRTARGASLGSMVLVSQSACALEFCLSTSASIRLASTAKPCPPTRPSEMQRVATVSKTTRSRCCHGIYPGGILRRWHDPALCRPDRAHKTTDTRGSNRPHHKADAQT